MVWRGGNYQAFRFPPISASGHAAHPEVVFREAILVEMDFAGGTADQYDQAARSTGLVDGRNELPPGLISHAVVVTEAGLRTFDVWESRHAFDVFVQSVPAESEHGPEPSEPPRLTELHNFVVRR